MSDLDEGALQTDADPWELPPATHPGELYEVSGSILPEIRCCGVSVLNLPLLNSAGTGLIRRLVHCRNLIDGSEGYAEQYEEEEHRALEAGLAAVGKELDERLARRIAERGAWMDDSELLAVCREEIARWAEPSLEDAPPARPDASASPEGAEREGESSRERRRGLWRAAVGRIPGGAVARVVPAVTVLRRESARQRALQRVGLPQLPAGRDRQGLLHDVGGGDAEGGGAVNDHQRTAISQHCRLACECVLPQFVYVERGFSVVLTVNSGYE